MTRSSRPEVFCRKGVLRNFAKFIGKHLCQSFFFNQVPGRPANLFRKILWHRCFPVNFAKFLRTPLFTERFQWLLLNDERFHLKASALLKKFKNDCFIIVDRVGVEICQKDYLPSNFYFHRRYIKYSINPNSYSLHLIKENKFITPFPITSFVRLT